MLSYGFKVEIWGEYACFTRPENSAERESYDVITPSAARGILESVMWKPAIEYVIDKIAICAPIRFEKIRRNEIDFSEKTEETEDLRTPITTKTLRNVHYVITAHFNMTEKATAEDNESKYSEMIRRRLGKGQHYQAPYLGMREFPAKVRILTESDPEPEAINESRALGRMLYDMEYIKKTDENGEETIKERIPKYFMAQMKHGIIDLRNV